MEWLGFFLKKFHWLKEKWVKHLYNYIKTISSTWSVIYIWYIDIHIQVYMQHEHSKNVLNYFWKTKTKRGKDLWLVSTPKGPPGSVQLLGEMLLLLCFFPNARSTFNKSYGMLRLRLDIWMDSHKGSFSYLYWAWNQTIQRYYGWWFRNPGSTHQLIFGSKYPVIYDVWF